MGASAHQGLFQTVFGDIIEPVRHKESRLPPIRSSVTQAQRKAHTGPRIGRLAMLEALTERLEQMVQTPPALDSGLWTQSLLEQFKIRR